MQDRYIFDKRNIKSGFKKYGIMFLICLPILVGVNFLLKDLSTGWVIFIDVVLALGVIIVLDLIVGKIEEKKEEKRKAKEEDEKLLSKVKGSSNTASNENGKVIKFDKNKRNKG